MFSYKNKPNVNIGSGVLCRGVEGDFIYETILDLALWNMIWQMTTNYADFDLSRHDMYAILVNHFNTLEEHSAQWQELLIRPQRIQRLYKNHQQGGFFSRKSKNSFLDTLPISKFKNCPKLLLDDNIVKNLSTFR